MKVSVIVPVYNVERFLPCCLESLAAQGMQELEFLLVDDGSTDRSGEICADFAARDGRFRLIRQENRGVVGAWNRGLDEARGEYLMFVDGDDWVEPDFCETPWRCAVEQDADLVLFRYRRANEEGEPFPAAPISVPVGQIDRDTALDLLFGAARSYVWNKLWRKSLFEGIRFPEGHAMGEDMTLIPVTARAGRVVHVPEALYHWYKSNPGAYSHAFSTRHLEDVRFNVDRTLALLSGEGFSEKDIAFFKLNIKLPFLLSGRKEQFRLWEEWFPEANRYILDNHLLPLRTRMVQFFAAHRLFFLVRLYCFAVDKLFYGFHRLFR